MKKAKTILLKFLMFLMALQILNLSIDIDYIAYNSQLNVRADFDDIDSFTEYLIEKITGDDNYTSEKDNDDGGPQDKGLEKYFTVILYFEPAAKVQADYNTYYASAWLRGLDQTNRTCKGYFNIISPPPKA